MGKANTPNWLEKAQFRKENRKWLEYSSQVARRIMSEIIKDKDNSQKKLAEALNVKPQMVSKIIKGQENLTLKSIAKISEVLGVELISFPKYRYSLPAIKVSKLEKVKFMATHEFAQYKVMSTDELSLLSLHSDFAHKTGGGSIDKITSNLKNSSYILQV